jgi:hypothetical protein
VRGCGLGDGCGLAVLGIGRVIAREGSETAKLTGRLHGDVLDCGEGEEGAFARFGRCCDEQQARRDHGGEFHGVVWGGLSRVALRHLRIRQETVSRCPIKPA